MGLFRFVAPLLVCGVFMSTFSQVTVNDAADFTAKDLLGNSHTLYTYLNAGKYVLIEFTATG